MHTHQRRAERKWSISRSGSTGVLVASRAGHRHALSSRRCGRPGSRQRSAPLAPAERGEQGTRDPEDLSKGSLPGSGRAMKRRLPTYLMVRPQARGQEPPSPLHNPGSSRSASRLSHPGGVEGFNPLCPLPIRSEDLTKEPFARVPWPPAGFVGFSSLCTPPQVPSGTLRRGILLVAPGSGSRGTDRLLPLGPFD